MSTVHDIDRFYTALWAGELLDQELVEAMSQPAGVAASIDAEYGMGVWFEHEPCGEAMGHSGAGPGLKTRAWTLPHAASSVVVVVNDGDGATIADDLAAVALCP